MEAYSNAIQIFYTLVLKQFRQVFSLEQCD